MAYDARHRCPDQPPQDPSRAAQRLGTGLPWWLCPGPLKTPHVVGKRRSELIAGADAELGEDLAQVVGDGGGADEQLGGDLRVGGAVAGQAGDERFLRGQDIGRLGSLLPGLPAGRPQLDAGPFGTRRGADRVEDLLRAAELIAGVAPAPLAAQPLAVDQAGAGEINPQAGTAEAVDRLAVEVLRGLAV